MNFEKNKSAIIIIVALLVVCVGSFFGVSAMTRSDSVMTTNTTLTPTAPPTQATTTTSAPVPTTQPVATTGVNLTEGTSASSSNLITTFPVTPGGTTTTRPSTTTTTTTTTTARPTTTAPTQGTTKAPSTGNSQADSIIENAAVFDEGFLSYMFNPDGNYYYTNSDPWQRALGYNEFFDVGAGFVSIYMDTMRCKFEYDNRDWMIQFWKGQYGYLFVGHEIGVYIKPKDREINHYDAASNEDALYMSMTGYRDGKELYTRDYAKYWWCTGFVPGKLDNFSDRSELQIKCRITMKDYSMLIGFCSALKENGMVLGENYTTSGLDVFVTW